MKSKQRQIESVLYESYNGIVKQIESEVFELKEDFDSKRWDAKFIACVCVSQSRDQIVFQHDRLLRLKNICRRMNVNPKGMLMGQIEFMINQTREMHSKGFIKIMGIVDPWYPLSKQCVMDRNSELLKLLELIPEATDEEDLFDV